MLDLSKKVSSNEGISKLEAYIHLESYIKLHHEELLPTFVSKNQGGSMEDSNDKESSSLMADNGDGENPLLDFDSTGPLPSSPNK